jgi:hypothetical protein
MLDTFIKGARASLHPNDKLDSKKLPPTQVGRAAVVNAVSRARKRPVAIRGRAFARNWIAKVMPGGAARRLTAAPKRLQKRFHGIFCTELKCHATFNQNKGLLRHVREDHFPGNPRKPQTGVLVCGIGTCIKSYQRRGTYTNHKLRSHIEDPLVDGGYL